MKPLEILLNHLKPTKNHWTPWNPMQQPETPWTLSPTQRYPGRVGTGDPRPDGGDQWIQWRLSPGSTTLSPPALSSFLSPSSWNRWHNLIPLWFSYLSTSSNFCSSYYFSYSYFSSYSSFYSYFYFSPFPFYFSSPTPPPGRSLPSQPRFSSSRSFPKERHSFLDFLSIFFNFPFFSSSITIFSLKNTALLNAS